ncbi:MAG: L-aspartate oxidase [Lachnospiraceae bacterium]|nr:L-aspartate oxidase [Lachnospiraceae bacterium]
MKDKYDVIIVGTGAAGLYAALSLPQSMSVLLITKDMAENSDSYLAQGGICMMLNDADYDSYFEDTMKAGRYENRKESVDIMLRSSKETIESLVEYGVEFEKNEDGSFSFTREGGHSTFRILHHDDVTGKEITEKLLMNVRKLENVELYEYTTMLDIISKGNEAKGIVVCTKDGEMKAVYSKKVILATGGIGGLFKDSTNFRHLTGDSFAIALRHGIELENLNYIQIHPTVFYSKKEGRRFLISESVRGEGAILLDKNGERFTDELQPRDVVTGEILKQMKKDGTDHVMLSIKHVMTSEEIAERFPNIYEYCLEEGYDLGKEAIPVVPAQHYLMGGIHTDKNGKTSMENLYAAGETACNGVHGANRLASNSLLESLIFAKRAADEIVMDIADDESKEIEIVAVDMDKYISINRWKNDNKKLIMDEIKRKDEDFYVKWCNTEN